MKKIFINKSLQALTFVICTFLSFYSLLNFIPFTYQQVVQTNLVPGLNEFIAYIPIANSLRNDFSSYVISILFLLPTLLLSALEIKKNIKVIWSKNSIQYEEIHGKEWRTFFALLLTGTIICILQTSFESDTSFFIKNLVSQLIIVGIYFTIISIILRIAEVMIDPSKFEFFTLGTILLVGVSYFTYNAVLRSLAFSNWLAIGYSFGFSSSVILFLLAAANAGQSEFKLLSSGGLSVITSASFPFYKARKKVSFVMLFLISSLFVYSLYKFYFLDWNFLIQKIIYLLYWFLAFSFIYQILPTNYSPLLKQKYIYVFLFFVLILFQLNMPALYTQEAGRSISYRFFKDIMFSKSKSLNKDFFSFLQHNTNIPEQVKVEPVNIVFAEKILNEPQVKHPHIFIFVIDSLRQDYLSAYNKNVNFTPEISSFADESIVFKNAFTRYGATGLSEPSIWTGAMLLHKQYTTPFEPMNSLQKLIRMENYKELISLDSILKVITTDSLNRTLLDPGTQTQDLEICNTLRQIQNKIEHHQFKDPTFVYTQSQNLHISVLNRNKSHRERYGKDAAGFFIPYSTEMKKVDTCFGQFITKLKESKIYDDSIIILTADHGDSLGEEGRFGHAYTIFPEIIKIPLIVHLPEIFKTKFNYDPLRLTFLTDITPSLYKLLDYKQIQSNWIFGRSLFWKKSEAKINREPGPYLLASSYGAVYGLLSEDARQLFIADGVNLIDRSYLLSENNSTQSAISPEQINENEDSIKKKITELNSFYRYKSNEYK